MTDYGRVQRTCAQVMPEAELRRRVDRLLEQAAREVAHPSPDNPQSGTLHASEIYYLLGVGPLPGAAALEELRRLVGQGSGEDPLCVCTHPRSAHNFNDVCIALPGVLGCGCLGFMEKR